MAGLPHGTGIEVVPSVLSKSPYRSFRFVAHAQATVGEFTNLYATAVGPDGSVYMADANSHRIQHFGSTGVLLNAWGKVGSGHGRFNYSTGIAVAADGTVYVADSGEARIQRFTATREHLAQWGQRGTADGSSSRGYTPLTDSRTVKAVDGCIATSALPS